MEKTTKKDVVIVVGGQAGQGIQTIEFILTRVLKRSGFHVFATKEYMSRIRGGSNSTLIRVGHKRVPANVDRIDVLVALDSDALEHLAGRITHDTMIIGELDKLPSDCECVEVPFTAIAEKAGGKIFTNTVAIAVLTGLLEADLDVLKEYLTEYFSNKGEETISRNIAAAQEGYQLGCELRSSLKSTFQIEKHPELSKELLISGGEAVALGAISGGCSFVASYPMSPSTSVLT